MDGINGHEGGVVVTGLEQSILSIPRSASVSAVDYNAGNARPKVPAVVGGIATHGVPVLQITIVHAGNTHTISKDDQYEYQYRSATGEVSSLPFDNTDDDLIEVSDGDSSFTLKRSMVYDYRKQANYYGALKVFRERTKVRRNGKDEVVIRTSLIQVRVTAKGKDGKKLGPNEIPPAVSKTPGIIPPVDPNEVESYRPPANTNMVPITFGNHIVDINKKAIEQFKKMSGVNRALKAQLSKLYKCKNGVDVPITVLKLFASARKGNNPPLKGGATTSTNPSNTANVVKWPPQGMSRKTGMRSTITGPALPDDCYSSPDADLKHYLTTKSTEVQCDLAQLGRSWCRYKPRDEGENDTVPSGEYVPQDMNEIIPPDVLWNYLVNYAKEMENLIDFEYEINEDRWLELKRASNTFHVNGEMWPDVVIKVVYRLNKDTKDYEITYYIRVLGRLIKAGVLIRGVDVKSIIQLLGHDRKICVGVMATPYLQLLDRNAEMCKVIKKDGLLVLYPFESLHSEKCCGLVRDMSQIHTNSFRRGSVGVEGEQVVCPPCLSLCARLNQLFSSTDYQPKPKPREQSAVVSSSGGPASNSAITAGSSAIVGVGVSAALRGSRVKEVLVQSLDDVLRSSNTRRALLEEDARLGLPASKRLNLDTDIVEQLEDPRSDVVLTQDQFVDMIDIRRPEVGGSKKHLFKSCNYCSYRAKTLLALFVHMKVHLGILQESCNKCKANFSDKNALEKHRIETHGQKTPECPVCFVELSSIDLLYDHMNRHRPHLPFICSYCSDSFSTLDAYKRHLKTTHKIKSISDLQIVCKTCQVHFYTQDHLILHRVNMNHNDVDLFTCKVCGYDFDTANSFREHIMEHTEEERDVANIAVCPTCYKVFFSAYRLNFHIERSHLMPKTDKESEQQPVNIMQQTTKKSNKGPYMRYLKQTEKNVCSVCNKRFKTEEILKSHIHFCHKGNKFDLSAKIGVLDKSASPQTTEYMSVQDNGQLVDEAGMVMSGNMVQMDNGQMVEMTPIDADMIQVDAERMQIANDMVHVGNSFVNLNAEMLPDNHTPKFVTTTTTASGGGAITTSVLLKQDFRCEMCGRKFDNENQLSSHMKIHSGNRPVFQCEECGQIYSKKTQVLDHIRIDHADQVQQHASQAQQQQHEEEQTSCSTPNTTTVHSAEPLLHYVDQASEQQVEVQTASRDDVMLLLQEFH